VRALAAICLLLALPASADELAVRKTARYFGASLEVGAPDILGVSLVGRPVKWLRLAAGINTDTAAVGVHGGLTFVPLDRIVSPSLSLEGGHMFEGGSTFLTEHLSPKSYVVEQLSYDYGSAHLGIEVDIKHRATFFLHAGASFISMDVHGHKRTPVTSGTVSLSDPNLQIWTFSGKLGFVVFFL
jgi:hypothetical protein